MNRVRFLKALFVVFLTLIMLAFQNCGKHSAQTSTATQASVGVLPQSPTGLRRLTQYELGNTLNYALGVKPTAQLASLPPDMATTTYFDNEAGAQPISSAVIASYQDFAKAYAAAAVAKTDFVKLVAGCTPTGSADISCFNKFAQIVGRRLLRRNLSSVEITRYADVLMPFAESDNNFLTAVQMYLTALIQHPEFLYRVEQTAGTLNDFEIATRMAFFVWGSGPDDALLNSAKAGELQIAANREAHAQRMLLDRRGKRHWQRFHSEWLGYEDASLNPRLAADFRLESAKLVERVTSELDRDWMEIFSWNETYVTPALAQNYGMGTITAAQWLPYGAGRGGGFLSHGSFLALGGKFGDTSPTLRGYEIFKRLYCGKLGAIPAGVDTDNPPGSPTDCKEKRYYMRSVATCASCHNITDNLGFGMENLNSLGQWRASEPGLPQCTISGNGKVKNTAFNGPAELGQLIKKDPQVSACAVTQMFRFMAGRLDTPADAITLKSLESQYWQTRTLKSLILKMVSSPLITLGRNSI